MSQDAMSPTRVFSHYSNHMGKDGRCHRGTVLARCLCPSPSGCVCSSGPQPWLATSHFRTRYLLMKKGWVSPQSMVGESEWRTLINQPYKHSFPTKHELGKFHICLFHLDFGVNHSRYTTLDICFMEGVVNFLHAEAEDSICMFLHNKIVFERKGFINYLNTPSRLTLSDSGNVDFSKFSWLIWRTQGQNRILSSLCNEPDGPCHLNAVIFQKLNTQECVSTQKQLPKTQAITSPHTRLLALGLS